MSNHLAVGVDLGGSHVNAGIVDMNANIISSSEKDIKKGKKPRDIILDDIYGVINSCLEMIDKKRKFVKGIGIGIPGRTDSKKGVCVYAPNLNWHNVPIRDILQEKTDLPIYILNDVRGMAVGEKVFGNGKGVDNFVSVAMGTGIGGGIVMNGMLYLGAHEGAGEIGHITIDPEGPLCGCGNKGCVEAHSSGPAIVARATKMLPEYPESILTKEPYLSPKIIFDAASQGDQLALKIWEDTGVYLGRALAAIATTVNPQRVLFSGKVARALDFFLPALKKELKERARLIPTDEIEFMAARFEDQAGVIGNAARVFEQLV